MRFWRGLGDYFASEYPDLPRADARPSPTLRVPSGLRHIGFELRLGILHPSVGIDAWFWRSASFPIWERVRNASDAYSALVGVSWEFDRSDEQPRARMYITSPSADVRDESSWPELYRWLGEKLTLVYERVVPKLRDEMDEGEAP